MGSKIQGETLPAGVKEQKVGLTGQWGKCFLRMGTQVVCNINGFALKCFFYIVGEKSHNAQAYPRKNCSCQQLKIHPKCHSKTFQEEQI